MTVTATDLDTKYATWFIDMRDIGQAKKEILQLFSNEPDKTHTYREGSSSNGVKLKFMMIDVV